MFESCVGENWDKCPEISEISSPAVQEAWVKHMFVKHYNEETGRSTNWELSAVVAIVRFQQQT